jgi:hypothetical protein
MPSNALNVRAKKFYRSLLFIGLCAFVTLPLACSTKNMYDTGLPGWTTQLKVIETVQRDRYLETHFRGDGIELHRFFPANDTCRDLLAPGSLLEFILVGHYGEFRRGDLQCSATGVADLEEWRRRFGKNSSLTTSSPIPRALAHYERVAQDDHSILLRGNFPLASYVRANVSQDLVLVLPHTPECELVADQITANMEYRPSGNPALALLSNQGRCAVRGFVAPINEP